MSEVDDDDEGVTLGEQIRDYRVHGTGLSLRAAARLAGMTSGAWSNIETGRPRDPSVFIVARMAHALGVPLDELMDGVEEPVRRKGGTPHSPGREITRRVDAFTRERGEIRARDLTETFGRARADYHIERMLREGKIVPVDPDLPTNSTRWRYCWTGGSA